jgi:hypothetical protein
LTGVKTFDPPVGDLIYEKLSRRNRRRSSPKRDLIRYVQARIPVIDEIQSAILKRTAVRFNLSKGDGINEPRYLVLIWTIT